MKDSRLIRVRDSERFPQNSKDMYVLDKFFHCKVYVDMLWINSTGHHNILLVQNNPPPKTDIHSEFDDHTLYME